MNDGRIRLTKHALDQMVDRQIRFDEVVAVLRTGRLVEVDRAETRIGWVRPGSAVPIGVVSRPEADGATLVVTVWWGDPLKWNDDFTERRKA